MPRACDSKADSFHSLRGEVRPSNGVNHSSRAPGEGGDHELDEQQKVFVGELLGLIAEHQI